MLQRDHEEGPRWQERDDLLPRARGADLWHLGCALFLKNRLHELAFVTLDRRHQELAEALGFSGVGQAEEAGTDWSAT